MREVTKVQIPLTGYAVEGDWYDSDSGRALLVLIGFASNKAKYCDFARKLQAVTGASVLVLEYSGHGDSPFDLGEISPAQHFLEVIAAFDWLKDQYPDESIGVLGTSYGGFMATQLTKYRTFDKLVLRVPALYPPDVFYDKLKTFENTNHFQSYRSATPELENHPLLKRASEFSGKTLVVTHELDDICPPNETGAFTRAFNAETWEQPGFKHGLSETTPEASVLEAYYQKIAEWLK